MEPGFAQASPGLADMPCLDVQEAYRQHAGFVGRSLLRLGVPNADLEDLTQEVFLVAHRRRDSYDPRARLTTWLFGIALRVAKRHRRRPWFTRERPMPDDAREPAHVHTPERAFEWSEEQRELDRALRTLRPERRAVLELFEIEGLALRDIATLTNTPIGTACSRLHAARKDLSRALRRSGLLAAVTAALVALWIGSAPNRDGEGFARTQLRREPATQPAFAPRRDDGAGAKVPAAAVGPAAPAAKVSLHAATRKPLERARHRAPVPAWLIEARAAVASDPERTLALIRANRDPGAPLSPELVELTLRALDAQQRIQDRSAASGP